MFIAFMSFTFAVAEAGSSSSSIVQEVPGYSAETSVLAGSDVVNLTSGVNHTSTHSRHLLAKIFSGAYAIKPGNSYRVSFTGHTCVDFSVTSSPEDLTVVMLMREISFEAFKRNQFKGAYLYVEGSKCEVTFKCEKTIKGLSKTETYVLLMMNGKEGFFGGPETATTVLMNTCPSTNPSVPKKSSAADAMKSYISFAAASIALILIY